MYFTVCSIPAIEKEYAAPLLHNGRAGAISCRVFKSVEKKDALHPGSLIFLFWNVLRISPDMMMSVSHRCAISPVQLSGISHKAVPVLP
ncbi:hypothetical protein EVAR_71869_1 [Eumeta japonica]|uniref:Uncharacterized protein n=1 Tax=Eumeta variegata TaxID=151549 RepID=A0A4C1STG3_EUMVA|nr:hypothetical protein EVAR_71869_1 [Eumeta japonica]